ncbi:MAG: restriction endonuclease subunit S [Hyphomicrobiaceae bacterium]
MLDPLKLVAPSGWELVPLIEVVEFLDSLRVPIKEADRALRQGAYPYYGASGVIDYVDGFIFDEELVLLAEDGANIINRSSPIAFRASGKIWVNNHAHVLRARSGNDVDYVAQFLEGLRYDAFNTGSTQPKLNRDVCEAIPTLRPPICEQRRIADILRTWDEAIEKTDRLIASKSKAFDHWSLMLLSGRKRLGSTRSNWQSVALTDVTSEATTRNGGSLGDDVVMGVNKSLGMIPMKDHVRAADLSRYKVVAPEAFAYNPMRLNIGSIAQNLHGREVLVSPDYVAFSANSDALLPAYFDYLRRSWLWSRFVKTAGSGGVRVRIYYDDLADFVFELPPVPEQRRIVDVLDTGRREIALLEAQRDTLAKQKRGLMQKLLTGEWPVSLPKSQEAAE